jgi:hypothetical protein
MALFFTGADNLTIIIRLESRGEIEACPLNGYQIAFFHDEYKPKDTLNHFGFAVEKCGRTLKRKAYCGIPRVLICNAISAEQVL